MKGKNRDDPYEGERERPDGSAAVGDTSGESHHAGEGDRGGTGFGRDGRGQHARKGQAQSPAEQNINQPPKQKEGHGS